jgi:hypothetical protein
MSVLDVLWVLLLPAAVILPTVGVGLWLHRLGAVCLVAALFFVCLWLLAFYALETDWHDAGGFVDCWPRCTTLQDVTGTMFWYAGPIAGILFLTALVTALLSYTRGTEANRIVLAVSLGILFVLVTIVALGIPQDRF